METEIRDLLRERAEDVRAETRIPPTVLRRARRRRALTAVAAAGIAAGVVAAAVVGTRAVLDHAAPEPPRPVPAGTLDDYEGIYPPLAVLRAIREGRVSADPWRSPEGVARRYAQNVLGWDAAQVEIRPGERPGQVRIGNSALGADAGFWTVLRMVPRGEIYTIRSAESQVIELESPSPSDVFRPGETILVTGRVEVEPPSGSIEVSLTAATDGTGAGAPIRREGAFTLPLDIPRRARGPILAVTMHDTSGATFAVTSFRLAVDPQAPPAGSLPPAVESTRAAIIEAATSRDWEALRALTPEQFSFSFGGGTDPIAYWKRQEARGEPVMDILVTLLEGPWAPSDFTPDRFYVWPGPAVKPAEDWTEKDEAILRRTASDREMELYRDYGSYIGWRVGIQPDGTWTSFIAGD